MLDKTESTGKTTTVPQQASSSDSPDSSNSSNSPHNNGQIFSQAIAPLGLILEDLKDLFSLSGLQLRQYLHAERSPLEKTDQKEEGEQKSAEKYKNYSHDLEHYTHVGNTQQRYQAYLLQGNICIYHLVTQVVTEEKPILRILRNCLKDFCTIYATVLGIATTSFPDLNSQRFAVLAGLQILGDNLKLVSQKMDKPFLQSDPSWLQFQTLEKQVNELIAASPASKDRLAAHQEQVPIAKLQAKHLPPAAASASALKKETCCVM